MFKLGLQGMKQRRRMRILSCKLSEASRRGAEQTNRHEKKWLDRPVGSDDNR